MRRPEEVMIFVRRRDELLVLHRSPAYESYWHVVAGGVEELESFAEAAAREVREETGLAAETVRPLGRRFTYPLRDESEVVRARFSPEVEEVVVESFLVEAPDGWEPALNEEHDAYRWCRPEAAAELLYWPEPRELVLELPCTEEEHAREPGAPDPAHQPSG